MAFHNFAVKLGQNEIGRLLDLRETIDHHEKLEWHASRYLQLGWELVGLAPHGEVDESIDFRQPAQSWGQRLAHLAEAKTMLNLGIKTGRASRLLVLEVNRGQGSLALDQRGDWRANCVAQLGDLREQHYYSLPPGVLPPASYFQANEALVYGEGGVVLAPPSQEAKAAEPWQWVRAPWDTPPRYPKPAVWDFLNQCASPEGENGPMPSWKEIYQQIASLTPLFHALLVPAPSQEDYYRGVLQTARSLGLKDRMLLLGLLWHAPHGDVRENPERWSALKQMVSESLRTFHLPIMPPGMVGGVANQAVLGSWPAASLMPGAGMLTAANAAPGEGQGGYGGSVPMPLAADQAGDPRTMSGRFFQLLSNLGERLITESLRHETNRGGLPVSAADAPLQLTDWNRRFCPSKTGGMDPAAEAPAVNSRQLHQDWVTFMRQQARHQEQFLEIQAAVEDFLQSHHDLANQRQNVLMVLFCLKNYVAINPEYANLPFRQKLEKAGDMARIFGEQFHEPGKDGSKW